MYHINSHFSHLIETIEALRSEKNGCPWDRRQTTSSLVKYLQAEFDELLEAIAREDHDNLCEELGDLLFLVVMVATINQEQAHFTIADVVKGITEKLIRRHPHVFAGSQITDEEQLREQWQRIKAMEKKKKLV